MLGSDADSSGSDADSVTASGWVYVMYAFRLERLLIVVRLARLVWQLRANESSNTIWAWVLYSRYSHLLRIAWIILSVVVIAHYIACVWAILTADAMSAASSWSENYAYSFYAALQLLQGQGIPTDSPAQDMFASFSILLGSLVLATVFGNVAILVANFSATLTNYQRKMEAVFAVMTKMRLPPALRERIHAYYEHLWSEYECLDGEIVQFTKELSHSLELEVVLFKYMEVVMHIPFFKDCTPDFQKQLLLSLQVRVYLPDDFIMREGEVGDEFFIVNRGYCELVGSPESFERVTGRTIEAGGNDYKRRFSRRRSSSVALMGFGREVKSAFELDEEHMERVGATRSALKRNAAPAQQQTVVTQGQAFCDLALLMNHQCAANVRAITHVEMCVLSRKSFQTVLTRYPDDRKRVILDMVTTYMDTCEKRKLPCPLLDMVRKVFVPSVRDSLSVAEAADRVYQAIDAGLRDTSIKYGIDDTTRERLVRLRDRKLQQAQPKVAGSPPAESTQSPDSSNSGAAALPEVFTNRTGKSVHHQQSQQHQHAPPSAEGAVTDSERQRITARLKQIEERERAIQVGLVHLDASLTELYAQHAAELEQAKAAPCASCRDRVQLKTVCVSTQTEDTGWSPPQLSPSATRRLAKKPRWVRNNSQPQIFVKNGDSGEVASSQAQVSPSRNVLVRNGSTFRGKGPQERLSRQRSHSVIGSSSNDPDLSGGNASNAPTAPLGVPLLQRMGSLVRLGVPAVAAAIESPTRFADELFNPGKNKEEFNGDESPPQTRRMSGQYQVRQTSDAESSLAAAGESGSVVEAGDGAAAAHDPVPNRRAQFQRKQSRSLSSLANSDGSRTPYILRAMGSIVGLLDGTKATPKPDESPTRYADELFQQTATQLQRRQS